MFTFLPGFWKGFGIYANYTHLDTKGDYGGATATTLVPGMTPKLANFAITYLSGKFDVRVNAIWRDVGLRTLSANEASMLWNYARTGINLKSKYTFSSRTALFLDIENLTSEPMPAVFRGNKERPSTWTLNPPKIIAGVTGRF